MLQRYTDEHIARPETMYVRTDYFVANKDLDGKNYFRVSTTKPINYALENTDEVKEMLQFFLQNLFRKNDFKEGQLPIILNALNRRDTIGLLPTGGGKSLCYQLPCLLQPAISVVICPIKSLMYDQKDNLDKAFITRTNFMVGEQEAETKQAIQREFSEGRYFFIWISPERFQIKSFRTYLSELYARTPLAYAVIDEVHCMSEWGHDFRTSYLNLTKTLHEYCPETALIGLTATASLNVLRNIQIELGRGNLAFDSENLKTKLNFSRPELMFEVVNDKGSKADLLKTTLKKLNDNKELMHQEAGNKAGLIFTPFANGDFGSCQKSKRLNVAYQHKVNWYSGACPTGRTVVKMPEAAFNNKELFIGAVKATIGDRMNEYELNDLFGKRSQLNYSKCLGSMDVTIKQVPILSEKEFEAHKKKVQEDFKADKFPLMVATKAFGMGIDKQNIYHTFHYGMPGSTESLCQEAGRAGRWDPKVDGNQDKQAVCRVLFSPETLDKSVMDALFDPKTTLAEIKTLTTLPTDSPHKAGDVLRQFFLFRMGLQPIDDELDIMQKLRVHILTIPKAPTVNVLWKPPVRSFVEEGQSGETFYTRLGAMSEDTRKSVTEKALYRLSILGIVQNWTTDFVCHFAVDFLVVTPEQVKENLITHLTKYRRDDAGKVNVLSQQIDETAGADILEKCMRFLLEWSWETIAYSRRQSLKSLYDLCIGFQDSKSFKQSLDNYFRVDDLTVILQYIADHPRQFEEWEKAFQTAGGLVALKPDQWKARTETLSRFLESSAENLGIDAISGLYRLALNDYGNSAGRARLENTLSRLKTYFTAPNEPQQVIRTIVGIGKAINLPFEARYELADSIERHYPGSYGWVSIELSILNVPQLTDVNKRLKNLNQKLYDQLLEA